MISNTLEFLHVCKLLTEDALPVDGVACVSTVDEKTRRGLSLPVLATASQRQSDELLLPLAKEEKLRPLINKMSNLFSNGSPSEEICFNEASPGVQSPTGGSCYDNSPLALPEISGGDACYISENHAVQCPVHSDTALFDDEVCTCSNHNDLLFSSKVDEDLSPLQAMDAIHISPTTLLSYVQTMPGNSDGFTFDYSGLTRRELCDFLPQPLREDMIAYCDLLSGNEPLAAAYESPAESVRSFKAGLSIEHHLLSLTRDSRKSIIALCFQEQLRSRFKERRLQNARRQKPYIPQNAQSIDSSRLRVIYIKTAPTVPKPVTFSVAAFRAWVHGEAARIWERSGVVPTLNHSAEMLYDGCHLPANLALEFLHKAEVLSMSWSEVKNSSSSADHFHRILTCGPLVFESEQDLDVFPEIFHRKHKPLYKFACKFLSSDDDFDVEKLSAAFEKAFPRSTWPIALKRLQQAKLQRTAIGIESFVLDESHFPSLSLTPHLQGNSIAVEAATSLHAQESVVDLGSDFGKGMVRGVSSELVATLPLIIRSVLNSILGMTAMALAQTPAQFGVAVAQTVINDPLAQSIIARLLNTVTRQGDEPELSWYASIMGTTFFSTIRQFLGEAYAALLPRFTEICGAVKFGSLKLLGENAAHWIASCLEELITRIKACVQQRSLQPLYGVDGRRWVAHSEGIRRYVATILAVGGSRKFDTDGVQDQLPPAFRRHMTRNEFYEALEEHIEAGERMLDVVTAPVARSMGLMMHSMRNLLSDVHADLDKNASRLNPFCVMFFGAPGCAKTTDADILAKALVRKEFRGDDDIYYYQNENFKTGLRSSTCVVRMDDPDSGLAPPSAASESYCDFIQHLASTDPYSVEQAGVEEKGKHFARPTDIIISSNHADLRATQYSSEPAAIWRRINLYIEPTVKPQYSTNKRIDRFKSPPVCGATTYTVYEFGDAGESGSEFRLNVLYKNLEWNHLMSFLLKSREEFLGAQRALLSARSEHCSACFFPKTHCVCADMLPYVADFEAESEVLVIPQERVVCSRPASDKANGKFTTTRLRSGALDPARQGQVPSAEASEADQHFRIVKDYFQSTAGLGLIAGVTGIAGIISGIVLLVKAYPQGRTAGVEVDSWFRADPIRDPAFPPEPPATWTKESLVSLCNNALVEVKSDDGSNVQGVIYRNGWVLFPTHAFGKSGLAEVFYHGRFDKIRKDSVDCKMLSNAELSVVYVSSLSGHNGIHKHMASYPVNAKRMGDAVLCGIRSYNFSEVYSRSHNNFPCWAYDCVTQNGDCGAVLIASGPGGAYRVHGMHLWATVPNLSSSWAGCAQVSADQIDAAIERATPMRTLFKQGLPQSTVPTLGHYPPKSEISVALTFYKCNAIHYGSMGNMGASLKTRLNKTSFHDRVTEFAKQQGVVEQYAPAVLKGGMVEDLYFSPYIHALRDTNNSSTTYFDVIDDYVQDLLGHFGGPLSELEAFKGVPGEFNSINVKTSMGAPVFGPKTNHVSPLREEISPTLAQHIDELETILAEGGVPIIIAQATLKDEVLKVGKPARVFCMLPAAFNVVCKRRFAVLKRALRSSYFASHNAVGIDMGSRQCEDLVQFVSQYQYVYGLDLSRMDKCWTPQAWDAVAETIKRIVCASSGDKVASEAYRLVLAMKECILNIKGDLFSAFWNVSGNDITVELNSILLSLMILKVCKISKVKPYFINYGDDDILCTQEPLPTDFFVVFSEVTGFVVTDDRKRTSPVASSLTEITFLKRSFRYCEQYNVWTAPLALSSIVKMLLYRGSSTLSDLDHETELLNAAERYLVLHGEEVFNTWTRFLRELAPYAHADFHQSMRLYVDWVFSDWTDRSLQHDGAPGLGVEQQGDKNMKMTSQFSHVAASALSGLLTGDGSEGHISTITASDISSDAAIVKVESEGVVVPAPTSFDTSMGPPEFPLGTFPERWTRIKIIPLSSSNTPVSAMSNGWIDTAQVTQNLLGDSHLRDKTKNWAWWRGDIEIMGVLSVPGNASGCYVLSVTPGYDVPFLSRAQSWYGYDCLAFDHTIILQMASSSSFTMTVPFFSAWDADTLADPGKSGYWHAKLTCLSPLRTSIPGGVSLGNLTVYARLKPGYSLLTPRWQGAMNQVFQQGDKIAPGKLISGALSTASRIADALGYSRTNEQTSNVPVVMRSVQNVAQVAGIDHGDVAGFTAGNAISSNSSVLGNSLEDPMSFASMSARWALIAGFDWNPSMLGGTVLQTVPVTPGYSSFSTEALIFNTGAGYCGLPFQYWRADAEYLVVIPASSLHRGALQVVYLANDDAAPTSADQVTNATMNSILEIGGSSMFQINVGYAQATPMASLAYSNFDNWGDVPEALNGRLQFRVTNPLISQNPADTIRVQIFVRFRNVQFAVPRTHLEYKDPGNMTIYNNPVEKAVKLQGEVPGDQDKNGSPIVVELVPASQPYPVADVCSGELVSSLRALAQKPSRLGINALNDGIYAYAYGGLGRRIDTTTHSLTTAALATAPFVTAASSERIKIMCNSEAWAAAYVAAADQGLYKSAFKNIPQSAPMTFLGPHKGAEFTLPYYYHDRGMITCATTQPYNDTGNRLPYQRLAIIRFHSSDPAVKPAVYYSLGNDIRVGPFYRLPVFVLQHEVLPYWTLPGA